MADESEGVGHYGGVVSLDLRGLLAQEWFGRLT